MSKKKTQLKFKKTVQCLCTADKWKQDTVVTAELEEGNSRKFQESKALRAERKTNTLKMWSMSSRLYPLGRLLPTWRAKELSWDRKEHFCNAGDTVRGLIYGLHWWLDSSDRRQKDTAMINPVWKDLQGRISSFRQSYFQVWSKFCLPFTSSQ